MIKHGIFWWQICPILYIRICFLTLSWELCFPVDFCFYFASLKGVGAGGNLRRRRKKKWTISKKKWKISPCKKLWYFLPNRCITCLLLTCYCLYVHLYKMKCLKLKSFPELHSCQVPAWNTIVCRVVAWVFSLKEAIFMMFIFKHFFIIADTCWSLLFLSCLVDFLQKTREL